MNRTERPQHMSENAKENISNEYKKASLNLKGTLSNMSGYMYNGVNIFGFSESERRTFDKDMYNSMRGALQNMLSLRYLGEKSQPQSSMDVRSTSETLTRYVKQQTGFEDISFGFEPLTIRAIENQYTIPSAVLLKYVQAEIRFQRAQIRVLQVEGSSIGKELVREAISKNLSTIKTLEQYLPQLQKGISVERVRNLNQLSSAEQEVRKQESPESILDEWSEA